MPFPLPPPMRRALDLAAEAAAAGEVPVGAVITRGEEIVAEARNAMRGSLDPTAHAEMVAIRAAGEAIGQPRLDGCTLWVTLEPCAMCAGALVHTRIRRVVFGCADPVAGAAGSVVNLLQTPGFNHRCDITSGPFQDECAAILLNFFRRRRRE